MVMVTAAFCWVDSHDDAPCSLYEMDPGKAMVVAISRYRDHIGGNTFMANLLTGLRCGVWAWYYLASAPVFALEDKSERVLGAAVFALVTTTVFLRIRGHGWGKIAGGTISVIGSVGGVVLAFLIVGPALASLDLTLIT